MESSNKVEARRAIDIAERKISKSDYVGAKKLVNKAHNLYPELDGLKQVSTMIDVYISASNKVNREGESDWYRVLGVDSLADDESLKRQYKKLALLLHPDKNKFSGAAEAFKLVLEAWCVLSDKAKRVAYDQKRTWKKVKTRRQKQRNPHHKPASPEASEPAAPATFWTMCNSCKTQCEYLRDSYLNKTVLCPNCGQTFVATKKTLSTSFEMPVNSSSSPQERQWDWGAQDKATDNNKDGESSSPGGNSSQSAEESPETLSAAEKVRKKLRRDKK